jgi:hypothetical protein
MTAPLTTLIAIAALGLVYVVVPIVGDVFFRFRRRRMVRCPATGLTAEIAIDARHAALTAVPGPPEVRVARCSLWPDRGDCEQKCLAAAR